ncbi:MAG: PspC domain-containing protein [Tissierellaceae bacterium]|nr:PspC domain-containing protein [Tissierellaceae bacterium]
MKRLTRSNTNKVFSGVLGGLGQYFGIDATIFRIIYVIFGFANPFFSLIVYGISSVIIPEDDGVIYQDTDYDYYDKSKDNSATFIGIGLILLGLVLLARIYLPSFHIIFPNFRYIIRRITDLWPILLIILGVFIIFRQRKN